MMFNALNITNWFEVFAAPLNQSRIEGTKPPLLVKDKSHIAREAAPQTHMTAGIARVSSIGQYYLA